MKRQKRRNLQELGVFVPAPSPLPGLTNRNSTESTGTALRGKKIEASLDSLGKHSSVGAFAISSVAALIWRTCHGVLAVQL
jgi:hypothetical protein